jgi:hypothetical protein
MTEVWDSWQEKAKSFGKGMETPISQIGTNWKRDDAAGKLGAQIADPHSSITIGGLLT